jgi:uncharacterized damage-inducible protein DinB
MTDLLLAQFDAEMDITRAVLGEVPGDRLDWTPHVRAFSLGRLAMHVATIPGWMSAFIEGDAYDMAPGGPGPAMPADTRVLHEAFEQARLRGRAAIEGCPDDQWESRWALRRGTMLIETMARAEALSRFGIRHLVHHRGQLTVYLRLLDCPIPPLYGDSADARLGGDPRP